MNVPKIAHAIGQIDEELIAAAETPAKAKRPAWVAWGAMAACLAVLALVGVALWGGTAPDDGAAERYKPHLVQTENTAIVWSWQYKTLTEKYTYFTLDGAEYGSQGRAVSEAFVDGLLGTYPVSGYDLHEDRQHTEEFEVYRLKYVDQSRCVAVKMESDYYVFRRNEYAPPATLGELFELVALPQVIQLDHFSENGDGPDAKHYTLQEDDALWQMLAECSQAPFVEDDWWMVHDRDYLSFSVTSEPLGVYRVAMYVTADGYLWTNALSYQYLFDIGEEAAGRIIQHAKEHSTEAEYRPYRKTVVGQITEITEDAVLVDDSLLCKDGVEGITYRVLLNDLRVTRAVELGMVAVGDTVEIPYDGEIDGENGHTVDSATAITKVRLLLDSEEEAPAPDGGEMVTMTTNAHISE